MNDDFEFTREKMKQILSGLARTLGAKHGEIYLMSDEPLGGVGKPRKVRRAVIDIGREFGTLRPLIGRACSNRVIGENIALHNWKKWNKGRKYQLPLYVVVAAVIGERVQQIEAARVGATVIDTTGFYEGGKEKAARFEIRWDERATAGSSALAEWPWRKFRANILTLAERVASKLAQQEIHVIFEDSGKQEFVSVTPVGFPPAPGVFEFVAREIEALP